MDASEVADGQHVGPRDLGAVYVASERRRGNGQSHGEDGPLVSRRRGRSPTAARGSLGSRRGDGRLDAGADASLPGSLGTMPERSVAPGASSALRGQACPSHDGEMATSKSTTAAKRSGRASPTKRKGAANTRGSQSTGKAVETPSEPSPGSIPPTALFELWFRGGPGVPIAVFSLREEHDLRYVLVARGSDEGLLLHLTWGKGGHLVSGGPKGWRIRKDRDTATGSGEYHYHCHKDGDEYVVKHDGRGSHDTGPGTVLPKKLGDFLSEELEIPLGRDGERYVVRFLPAWSWEPRLQRWAVEYVNDVLNAELADVHR